MCGKQRSYDVFFEIPCSPDIHYGEVSFVPS